MIDFAGARGLQLFSASEVGRDRERLRTSDLIRHDDVTYHHKVILNTGVCLALPKNQRNRISGYNDGRDVK